MGINHSWMAPAIECAQWRAIKAWPDYRDHPDYINAWSFIRSPFMPIADKQGMLLPPEEDDPQWYR